MSKLTLKLDRISDDSLKEARESSGGFQQYEGPTPPPDTYTLKLDGLMSGQTKTGRDKLVAFFKVVGKGDKEVYDGAPITENYMIPGDSEDPNYHVFISILDQFLLQVSNGKLSIQQFVDAAIDGKILTEETKGKSGLQRITQIGKFKVANAVEVEAKTDIRHYQDKDYPEIKFFVDKKSSSTPAGNSTDDSDDEDFDLDLDDDLEL